MSDPKNLVRTRDLARDAAIHARHPLNPQSEIILHALGDRVGMQRAMLWLARVPPGKESFIAPAHVTQEEFVFII